MIGKLLDSEGPVIGFLNKAGTLIGLSLIWAVCSVPVITAGAATAAFYYAVIKSVRRGQGSALREFFRSFRRCLPQGILVTVTTVLLAVSLYRNLLIAESAMLRRVFQAGLMVLAAVCIYICPVLSRFRLKLSRCWMLAFLMAVRYAHFTALILAAAWLLGWLQLYVFPIPCVLLLPGFGVWASTFLVEKALLHHMPPREEQEDAWYYEGK